MELQDEVLLTKIQGHVDSFGHDKAKGLQDEVLLKRFEATETAVFIIKLWSFKMRYF